MRRPYTFANLDLMLRLARSIKKATWKRVCVNALAIWPLSRTIVRKETRSLPAEVCRGLFELNRSPLPRHERCQFLGVLRCTQYYRPRAAKASRLAVMRRLAEQYTRRFFAGVEGVTTWLAIEGRHKVWSTGK